MKNQGALVDEIPEGFEIYENYNSQVFLRKIQPKLVTDDEIAVVEEGMRRYSESKFHYIEVKINKIVIYSTTQDVDALSEILKYSPITKDVGFDKALVSRIRYLPMLQFVLVDDKKRLFRPERFCFLGSIDDWIIIGGAGRLENLVKTYVRHIGKESFYSMDYL